MGILGPPLMNMYERGKRSHENFYRSSLGKSSRTKRCAEAYENKLTGKCKQDINTPMGVI